MNKKKIVLVGGCFDILHFGHVHFLKQAKNLGDYLIVALESDINVKRLKGSTRPIHNESQRKEILESLSFVDEVRILPEMKDDKDYEKLVIEVSPNIIAITKNDPFINKKRGHAEKIGAHVIEIDKVGIPSSSQIAKLLEIE